MVVGEAVHQVTATALDGSMPSVTFTATARTFAVPSEEFVGWPTVLVSRRGQLIGLFNQSIEAYAPNTPALPLTVALFVVREDLTVTPCADGSSRWCTVPSGTWSTKRLTNGAVEGCYPEGCGSGSLEESGSINFSGAGVNQDVSQQNEDGQFSFTLTMPETPGRYEIVAAPTVSVAVPRTPNISHYFNEIVPCPNADMACGSELRLLEFSDPNWRTTFVLWSVQAKIQDDPMPVVKLGHNNRVETLVPFPYTIEPEDYPPLNTVVYFLEDGGVMLTAQDDGRGTGEALLAPGEVFTDPQAPHKVGIALNAGWVWQPFPGDAVSMMLDGEQVPFVVVKFDVDMDTDNNNLGEEPERTDVEEDLEEGEDTFGAIIFANVNYDDHDDLPDYANREVEGERNLIPVIL